MTVRVDVEWSSSHDVDPPPGVTDEAFEQQLREQGPAGEAWEYALDQVYSGTAELSDWRVV